jgi:RNA polymerase sigma factor (TIGR02999 family)
MPRHALLRRASVCRTGARNRKRTNAALPLSYGKFGRIRSMSDVTRILSKIEAGDPSAAEQLLPLVYEELRELAAARLAREQPGQTLQATALDVHKAQQWNSRGHFFAAAAEAMRRILVESARKRSRQKRGGDLERSALEDVGWIGRSSPSEVLAVDEALSKLAAEDPAAGQLVKLRYFADFSIEEAADMLGISRASAYRHWTFAKAWLRWELRDCDAATPG